MSESASRRTWLDKVQLYANVANHMLIAVVAFYTTWLCLMIEREPSIFSVYSWHTWLCTIGVSVFFSLNGTHT